MLVAYKYRLYPNKEQQEYFAKCFGLFIPRFAGKTKEQRN